ncbi:unnamed protein product [Calypogeia fissa]
MMWWQRSVVVAVRRIRAAAEQKSGSWQQPQQVRSKHWLAMWGNGDQGRLGLSTVDSQWKPTLCSSLQDQEPVAVACGGAHTLVLTGNGCIFAMGLNDYGQLGLPLDTPHSSDPVEVKGLPSRCVFVSAGYHHSAAITEDGAVYVWGSNSNGQLGLGKNALSKTWSPQRVDALKDLQIKMLALGSEHSLGLTEDGEVLSWGSGQNGQLGHGQPNGLFHYLRNSSECYPRLIDGLRGIRARAISAGLMHSACVDQLGNLFTFGQGRMCQLGHGDTRDSFEPLAVTNLPSCAGVACGGYHTGAISRNGDLYTWGSNEYGCLGFGYQHSNQMVFPLKVDGVLARLRVSEVACGWKHTCALTVDGQLYAWGWGGSQGTYSTDARSSGGQLGAGDEFDYNEPTLVSTNSMRALHVSCGFNHTGAILME